MKIMKSRTPAAALLLLAPAVIVAADASSPSLTPQQLIDQVRAQQAAADVAAPSSRPLLATVPAPPAAGATFVPAMRAASRMPTLEDKSRLEAQLAYVNSSLK